MEGERKVNPGDQGSSNGEDRGIGAAKKKRGERKKSGSLPLALFLSLEQTSVRPDCIHASNPFHKCADHCFRRIASASKSTERAKTEDGRGIKKMEEKKKEHPKCIKASNPYHKCTENCTRKISEKDGAGRVVAAKGKKDVVDIVERRNVLPICPYASNPYHTTCVESCLQRIPGAVMAKEMKRAAIKTTTEVINLQPNCKYASNPYHNCAEYCSQRKPGKDGKKSSKKEERVRTVGMTKKENARSTSVDKFDPLGECVGDEGLVGGAKSDQTEEAAESIDASNPHHTCTETSPNMDQADEGDSWLLPPAHVLLPEFIYVLVYVVHLIIISVVFKKKK